MEKIRFGIIGLGRVGERLVHAISASKNAELWSVYSRSITRAEALAQKYQARGPSPAFNDLDAMLSDMDLDAVIVSTPDNIHFESIERACRYGKHVLVEKPLVTDIQQGRRSVELSKECSVKLGVAYHLRFEPNLRLLANRIHSGEIGKIHHISMHWAYHFPPTENWRSKRDLGRFWSLSALGTHMLDLIRWYLLPSCGEVVELKGMTTRTRLKSQNDESAMALFKFESGATAELVSSIHYDHRLSLEIFGSDGFAKGYEITGDDSVNPVIINGSPIIVADQNPYVGEIEDFAEAILKNRDPEVTAAEGLRNLELLLQIDPT